MVCRQKIDMPCWYLYDLVWYAANYPELHRAHLDQRMRQSGHWPGSKAMDADAFRTLLGERIDTLQLKYA